MRREIKIDPELLDKEEKWQDGALRKIVVHGAYGTMRVIYTARRIDNPSLHEAHTYRGRVQIHRVQAEDLSLVTGLKELWYILRPLRKYGRAEDELYFESLYCAMRWADKHLLGDK